MKTKTTNSVTLTPRPPSPLFSAFRGLALPASLLLLGSAAKSAAATLTWQGGGFFWSDAANWVGGLPPGSGNSALFGTDGDNAILDGNYSVKGLQLTAAGTVDISDNGDNYSLTIGSSGILQLAVNTTTINTVGVILNGNQTWATAGSITVTGGISGASNLTKSGIGTLTLEGANTYGNTTISGGMLVLNGSTSGNTTIGGGKLILNGSLAASSTVSLTSATSVLDMTGFAGGTQTITGLTGSLAGAEIKLAANTLVLNESANFVYAGNISGTGGSLTKTGTGTQTLTGTNTYTGTTTISGGTLQAGSGGTTGSVGTGPVVNNAALIVDRSNAVAISGIISGTGTLLKAGAGTLTLSAANTYSGLTTVQAGTLTLSGSGSLHDTGTVDLSLAGSAFNISAISASGETIGKLTGAAGTSAVLGAKTLTLSDAGSYSFEGDISGTGGGLTKLGAGTLTLAGTNTHSGTTTISAGTLQVGAGGTSGSLGSGPVVNNAALVVNRSDASAIAGGISGSGTLLKSGAGILTLSGANTYTGVTTVDGGGVTLSGSGSLLDAAVVNLSSSGTSFDIGAISATSESIAKVTAVAGASVSVSSGKTLELLTDDNFTFGGDFAGAGIVKKSGSGILTITGNNTSTGRLQIASGTLLLGAAGTLSNTAQLSLSSGTKLKTDSLSDTAGSLAITGNAVIDMGTGSGSILTFGDVGTWAGVLSVWNYNGAQWTAGTDKLIFSANSGGANLTTVQFYSDNGVTPVGVGADFLGTELVPVPEASSVLTGLLLIGGLCLHERRSFLHYRK